MHLKLVINKLSFCAKANALKKICAIEYGTYTFDAMFYNLFHSIHISLINHQKCIPKENGLKNGLFCDDDDNNNVDDSVNTSRRV